MPVFAHSLEVRTAALEMLRSGAPNSDVAAALRIPQQVGCHDVMSSSTHWKCLFPQHGPGRKHERAIVLGCWQREIVDEFPEEFIRGLIHSDGCRVYNVAVRTRGEKTTRYYYSRYHFTNESPHIRDLFTDALDRLGVEWRYNRRNCISIAKRESVRRLDAFVGPKY